LSVAGGPRRELLSGPKPGEIRGYFDFAEAKNAVRQRQPICVFMDPTQRDKSVSAIAGDLSFEPDTLRRH
jgi:hypothetical protein